MSAGPAPGWSAPPAAAVPTVEKMPAPMMAPIAERGERPDREVAPQGRAVPLLGRRQDLVEAFPAQQIGEQADPSLFVAVRAKTGGVCHALRRPPRRARGAGPPALRLRA